ncbi:HpcH/HpaI aldolase family protein [Pelagibacterium luteolum]|uniref:2-dehydro-3-deoxyglucarate aldolase n=1 Tax=Pelagibacterium luteolum TaxID=440168 RepID=A0A1G7UZY6_9HYPH|nr:aldolase/citrate lyase family protein [Pelagibacterium luteolum]SDG53057.1 2-dehydro-3-deoxyglucarate aldolase [Pelagibacterium luteolum]
MHILTKTIVAGLMACSMAGSAVAQDAAFLASEWEYGPAYDVEGEVEIWNTAKQKILNGEHIIGGTVRSPDSRIYCSMAESGAWDFMWVEMQHDQTGWESLAAMYRECPDAAAVPGVRIAETTEREIQHALDAGAMVLVVPTIDTAEEAEEAVKWTMFPPVGRHSAGGGQFSNFYADVPGGYRATFNDNIVLILMIETLEGVENVEEIAAVEGVDALFIASGDLGNFSGYQQGDAEYEELVDRIFAAAEANGKPVCGPLDWRTSREGYSCFQGPNDLGLVANGSRSAREASEPQ